VSNNVVLVYCCHHSIYAFLPLFFYLLFLSTRMSNYLACNLHRKHQSNKVTLAIISLSSSESPFSYDEQGPINMIIHGRPTFNELTKFESENLKLRACIVYTNPFLYWIFLADDTFETSATFYPFQKPSPHTGLPFTTIVPLYYFPTAIAPTFNKRLSQLQSAEKAVNERFNPPQFPIYFHFTLLHHLINRFEANLSPCRKTLMARR
jgi:hypothetical protein